MPRAVQGQYAHIVGGPTYDGATDVGYLLTPVTDYLGFATGNGYAIGSVVRRNAGVSEGSRAVWWEMSSAAVELGGLGADADGDFTTTAYAVNSAGVSVGVADAFAADGTPLGNRAVRWTAPGAVEVLGNLGVDDAGYGLGVAYAINDAGVMVGNASKYDQGYSQGSRAVRWDASGAATELGAVTADGSGGSGEFGAAYGVNQNGDAIGFGSYYQAGDFLGYRAVRWDAGTTAPLMLATLGTSSDGRGATISHSLNYNRMAVGSSQKWDADAYFGVRAVRWDASGDVTELQSLGADGNDVAFGEAIAINSLGVAVGYADKFDVGNDKGEAAVRWDVAGNATQLGSLGATASRKTSSRAYSINDLGLAVGHTTVYTPLGFRIGQRAVVWNASGQAIDLNDLIDPDSGWSKLSDAFHINGGNWITGVGVFDPDGPGGQRAYGRLFLMHVPEPTAVGLAACGGVGLLCWRRRKVKCGRKTTHAAWMITDVLRRRDVFDSSARTR